MAYHTVIISNNQYNSLCPVQFGYENCKSRHHFGPAVRQYHLIHFVVSGFGKFIINNNVYHIGPGEMFVIPPMVETYYEADSKNPWEYIWIGFTTDKLPISLNDTISCPEAHSIFNAMKKCAKFENGRSAFLSAKLWELFSLLLENESHYPDYIDKALDFIQSEYMKNINVDTLASMLNLDRSYFTTLFTKKVGISPGKYIFNHRMSIAASLLVNNNTSVSVTANSVGYSDIFNFSKMFKKHFGISPTEYVKKHHNIKL